MDVLHKLKFPFMQKEAEKMSEIAQNLYEEENYLKMQESKNWHNFKW